LEPGISADDEKGQAVDAEPMALAKVSTEALIGNAIAVVAAALLPSAVVGIPAL